jgi:hypothetical protein
MIYLIGYLVPVDQVELLVGHFPPFPEEGFDYFFHFFGDAFWGTKHKDLIYGKRL